MTLTAIKQERGIMKRLTYAMVFGLVLMSVGVFLVGNHVPYGNVVLIIASAIVYVSIIILAFVA